MTDTSTRPAADIHATAAAESGPPAGTSATGEETRYPVDPVASLRAALSWLRNPVSANGPRSLRRLMFASGGPAKQRQVEEMRAHPDGRRILAERPDLCATLSDLDALAALPEGSLGRHFHEFMTHPAALPTYLLAAALYEDGEFDRLDWSDDMKYLTERLNATHDLTHIVSEYGTHLVGEAININFNAGFEGTPRPAGHALTALWFLIGLPRIGWRRFHELCMEAFDRGVALRRTIPWHCIPWEELLPLPLEEVQRRLGVPPLGRPLDTSDWMRNPLGNAMARGFGQGGTPESKARMKGIAERLGGFRADPRHLIRVLSLPEETQERLGAAYESGADEAELRRIAGLPPRAAVAA